MFFIMISATEIHWFRQLTVTDAVYAATQEDLQQASHFLNFLGHQVIREIHQSLFVVAVRSKVQPSEVDSAPQQSVRTSHTSDMDTSNLYLKYMFAEPQAMHLVHVQ